MTEQTTFFVYTNTIKNSYLIFTSYFKFIDGYLWKIGFICLFFLTVCTHIFCFISLKNGNEKKITISCILVIVITLFLLLPTYGLAAFNFLPPIYIKRYRMWKALLVKYGFIDENIDDKINQDTHVDENYWFVVRYIYCVTNCKTKTNYALASLLCFQFIEVLLNCYRLNFHFTYGS